MTRDRAEAELAALVAAELRRTRRAALTIAPEWPAPAGGRVDVAVLAGGSPVELVEVKVRRPLAGIGQLLGYCYGLPARPRLTLAVPWVARSPQLAHACELAGVGLWLVEDPGQRARRRRFEARQPARSGALAADLHQRAAAEYEWRRPRSGPSRRPRPAAAPAAGSCSRLGGPRPRAGRSRREGSRDARKR